MKQRLIKKYNPGGSFSLDGGTG
jgi:hypothetical protein